MKIQKLRSGQCCKTISDSKSRVTRKKNIARKANKNNKWLF